MSLACLFCNQRCNINALRQTYWCKDCKVHYAGEKDYLHNITFDTKIKEAQYELTIDVEKDTTTLRCWAVEDPRMELDVLKLVMEFHPAMKGVTPQNVLDKIKTILTYS